MCAYGRVRVDGWEIVIKMKKLAMVIATCCGAGYAPFAPGTAGAIVGMIPALALSPWPLAYAAAAAALLVAGVAAGSAAESALGRKDPPCVVIDEAASVMLTFAAIPLTAWTIPAGFVLNRALDIVKPFPADRLQALRGGWGIMMDDVVAGIYANLALRIAWALLAARGAQ